MAETLTLNVNMENLNEEERKQLLAIVKKSTEEKPKVWKPKNNEKYYFIYSQGKLSNTIWNDSSMDASLYAIGNCFRTKKEAEFAIEKQKVITELKRFSQEHNEKIDWEDKSWKYCITYDYAINKVTYISALTSKRNDIYFSSKEIAKQAIKAIGADRLKKYYFKVEN